MNIFKTRYKGILLTLMIPFSVGFIIVALFLLKSPTPRYHACSSQSEKGYCGQVIEDKQLMMLTLDNEGKGNCCLIDRYNVDLGEMDFSIRACTKNTELNINCSNFKEVIDFGMSFKVDGNIIYKDLSWNADMAGQ